MNWSGFHDGCPLHGHAVDAEKGEEIGCICADINPVQIVRDHARITQLEAAERQAHKDGFMSAVNTYRIFHDADDEQSEDDVKIDEEGSWDARARAAGKGDYEAEARKEAANPPR